MTTIGVSAPPLSPGLKATLDALGDALNVAFESRAFGDDTGLAGWLVLGAPRAFVGEIGRTTRPCYVVLDERELIPCGASSSIRFSAGSDLPAALRGRQVSADDAVDVRALPPWVPDLVPVAFKDGAPVWGVQQRGATRHQYVSMAPPALADGEALFTQFSGQRLARLLPLVLFVRSFTDDQRWEPPPLQAAFMFDDPNLHWTSYGFIDYREMVRHATAGRYHVTMATIPLDAWFVHAPAVAIFRERRAHISLLYHGNDHVAQELGRPQSTEAMQLRLRRAVGRIEGMEARTGLEVSRVMAPPHGACSENAIAAMARLGFEAVCISRGSLRFHNPRAPWTRTIGLRPCDVVAGLPAIPRFGLTAGCRNDVLIAALLRQPIVPMTHHQALAYGYDLIDEIGSFVNGFGDVAWRDMKTIARSLFSQRREDDTLWVKMWCKRVHVVVPEDATRLQVHRAGVEDAAAAEALYWRETSGEGRWNLVPPFEPIPVRPGTSIEVASGQTGAHIDTVAAGRPDLAPIARRFLTEVRDRALPSLHRVARRRRSRDLA